MTDEKAPSPGGCCGDYFIRESNQESKQARELTVEFKKWCNVSLKSEVCILKTKDDTSIERVAGGSLLLRPNTYSSLVGVLWTTFHSSSTSSTRKNHGLR